MKGFKRTFFCLLILTVAIIAACGSKAYRTVELTEINGSASVNSKAANVGMHLVTGDNVDVAAASYITMLLDSDKHVLATENTKFSLVADGKEGSTKTVIKVDTGTIVSEIDNKLGPEESYQVDTPSATMSVRGTTFDVTVYEDGGVLYTDVRVTEGTVICDFKNKDASYNGLSKTLEAGDAIVVMATDDGTEFIDISEEVASGNYGSTSGPDGSSGPNGGASSVFADAQEKASHWVKIENLYNEEEGYGDIYDDQGRIIASIFWGYKEEYQYNADGSYKIDYYAEDSSGEMVYLGYALFDKYGLELGGHQAWSVYYALRDDFMDYEYAYEFLEPGKPTRSQYVSAEDGPLDFYTYEYDDHGNLLLKQHYNENGEFLEDSEYERNEYIEINGQYIISKHIEIDREEGETFEITTSYEYDSNGFLLSETEIIISDVDGTYGTITTYENNSNGQPIYVESKGLKATAASDTYSYEYDEYGNMIHEMHTYTLENYVGDFYHEYSFLVFPEGKPGDTLTRTITTSGTSDGDEVSYTYDEYYVYSKISD